MNLQWSKNKIVKKKSYLMTFFWREMILLFKNKIQAFISSSFFSI